MLMVHARSFFVSKAMVYDDNHLAEMVKAAATMTFDVGFS
jgi:hypothetical protein